MPVTRWITKPSMPEYFQRYLRASSSAFELVMEFTGAQHGALEADDRVGQVNVLRAGGDAVELRVTAPHAGFGRQRLDALVDGVVARVEQSQQPAVDGGGAEV